MPNYPDDDDGAVLARLEAHGADLSQPMLIEFIVAAPSDKAAEAIQTALADEGYDPHVEYDEGEPNENGELDPDDDEYGPSWTVYVEIEMVPIYNDIVRIQMELDHIAAPLGGRSDGWGTLVEGE